MHGVARGCLNRSSRSSPELGFRVLQKNLERRREECGPRVSLAAASLLIGPGGRWPSSPVSIRRRWIDRSPLLHRAACQLEEDDNSSTRNGMSGWTAVDW
jgi:hypothetical protein